MRLPLSSSYIPKTYNQQSWWQIIHRILQPLNQILDGYLFQAADNAPITSDYSIPVTVAWVPVDASGGAVTVTLPDADESKGKRLTVKKIDTTLNIVTVTSTQTIDNRASVTISKGYTSLCFMSDGVEWWIV